MPSHRAQAVPETRQSRSGARAEPREPLSDLLDVFRTPVTPSASPAPSPAPFEEMFLARRPAVAVLEPPAPSSRPAQPRPAQPRPAQLRPAQPRPVQPHVSAPVVAAPVPVATPSPGGPPTGGFRTRAERRAAERSGQTPPWGLPLVTDAPRGVDVVVPDRIPDDFDGAPAPEQARPAAPQSGHRPGMPALSATHHVLPAAAAVPAGGIDPHVFDDNARTAPQPVLPSRRELRGKLAEPAKPARTKAAKPAASRRTSGERLPSAPRRDAARPQTARSGMRASHVAIVGTLGIATIAVPMSGALTPSGAEPLTGQFPVALPAAPEFPSLARPLTSVERLTLLPPTALRGDSDIPNALAMPRIMLVDRVSRGKNERPVLPGCTGIVRRTTAGNGRLDDADLCTLWNRKHRLRADAAVALAKLNIAYQRRFGHSVCLTDSYRTLGEQRHLKAIKPGLAATPGTSEHGWGLAVDLCDGVERGRSIQYRWLRANATNFGWDNPDWALPGGSGPYEPWHWEYVAGE